MNKIFAPFLPPWVETGLQPAFYDMESGTVLQQTARMYAKVQQLTRLFNELSEETKDTVEEYIEKFTELKDFVEDYFDNLDVQEEINNKLDAMVEDGTLQELINNYLQPNVTWTFDTVADMQAFENFEDGCFAQTLGYYSANDGGGATYFISDSGTPDGGTCISLSNSLYAHLVIKDDTVNVKQFGAKGDGVSNDTTAITNALNTAGKVIFSDGTYLINNISTHDLSVQLVGVNATITNGQFLFNDSNVKISNIDFSNTLTKALYFSGCLAEIENCSFDTITTDPEANLSAHGAIYAEHNVDLTVKDCKFNNVKSYGGVYTHGQGKLSATGNTFNNCDYRAFNIIEDEDYNSTPLVGYIANNTINNCGALNPTGSGVGCNGIYAHGCQLDIKDNTITNIVENAIEISSSYTNNVVNNYIDGTNVDLTNKPTPSIEAIYIHSDGIVSNNVIKNWRRRGISCPATTLVNNYNLLITNNTITDAQSYSGGSDTDAILVSSNVSTSNKKIFNNNTTYNVKCLNGLNNTQYIGDVKLLSDTTTKFNNVTSLNSVIRYQNYFNTTSDYNGFTLSSISTPSIVTITDTNLKALYFEYQAYNAIKSPEFAPKGAFMIRVKGNYLGTMQIRVFKNNAYFRTIKETAKVNTLTNFDTEYLLFTADDTSYYDIRINEPTADESLTLSDVDIEVIC